MAAVGTTDGTLFAHTARDPLQIGTHQAHTSAITAMVSECTIRATITAIKNECTKVRNYCFDECTYVYMSHHCHGECNAMSAISDIVSALLCQ